MAELRTDWLSGRSVLVAENRALRPNEFAGEAGPLTGPGSEARLADCPFCVGNESLTPTAVYEKRDSDGHWQIRVVPNKFPALTLPSEAVDVAAVTAANASAADYTQASPANGAHEVIIESARHVDRLSSLSKPEIRAVLEAYAERLRTWREDGLFRYGLVFKNQGPRAGASIAHLHSQLIALPFVPSVVDAEQRRAAESYSQHGLCPYCRLVTGEQAAGRRIVRSGDGFLAFCPFASLQPYEVWLMPIAHESSFESVDANGLERLAGVLHDLVHQLKTLVPDAAYNMLLRTPPWVAGCDEWSHWRIELLPRSNPLAGLEIATGVHINPVAPERAARQLHIG